MYSAAGGGMGGSSKRGAAPLLSRSCRNSRKRKRSRGQATRIAPGTGWPIAGRTATDVGLRVPRWV